MPLVVAVFRHHFGVVLWGTRCPEQDLVQYVWTVGSDP